MDGTAGRMLTAAFLALVSLALAAGCVFAGWFFFGRSEAPGEQVRVSGCSREHRANGIPYGACEGQLLADDGSDRAAATVKVIAKDTRPDGDVLTVSKSPLNGTYAEDDGKDPSTLSQVLGWLVGAFAVAVLAVLSFGTAKLAVGFATGP